MTSEVELCPDCQKLGHCQFKSFVEEINASTPEDRDSVLKVHEEDITPSREMARKRGCPLVNDLDLSPRLKKFL